MWKDIEAQPPFKFLTAQLELVSTFPGLLKEASLTKNERASSRFGPNQAAASRVQGPTHSVHRPRSVSFPPILTATVPLATYICCESASEEWTQISSHERVWLVFNVVRGDR